MNKEWEGSWRRLIELVGLGLPLEEIATESGVEDLRVVTSELFIDLKFLGFVRWTNKEGNEAVAGTA